MVNWFVTSDAPIHASSLNLRPDKMINFELGLSVCTEGWWDCCSYSTKDGNGYKWMDIGWDISTGDKKLFFWAKALTLAPPTLQLDWLWIELVDHTTPNSMGYGPEHFSKCVKTVDDMLDLASNHHILKDFFFTPSEVKRLKLHHYVKR